MIRSDLEGTLSIRDKSVPIALAVNEMDRSRSPRGEEFVYYSATTELDRFAFGISYGRGLIGRRLKVRLMFKLQTANKPQIAQITRIKPWKIYSKTFATAFAC